MKMRERFAAVAKGVAPERALTIGLAKEADATIVLPNQVGSSPGSEIVLVISPLARSIGRGLDVLKTLADDPIQGDVELSSLEQETRSEMASALKKGAIGVFYFLDGAYPAISTPMQYGGHFLERDRRLLIEFADAPFNVLFVNGKHEPYIDFVSDLPAGGFAWDLSSGVTNDDVGQMRKGALMGAEFVLEATAGEIMNLATEKAVC